MTNEELQNEISDLQDKVEKLEKESFKFPLQKPQKDALFRALEKMKLIASAGFPWVRGYFGEDIRLGYGSSDGSEVQYIKWGDGTPESVVDANVGSIYLRKDGGSGTTLYVKESGTGTTGWSAV